MYHFYNLFLSGFVFEQRVDFLHFNCRIELHCINYSLAIPLLKKNVFFYNKKYFQIVQEFVERETETELLGSSM